MKRNLKILLILLIGINGDGFSQSLDRYLEEAAKNNPLLKAKHADFEAAVKKVAQVNSLPNPNISFGYLISPTIPHPGNQKAGLGIRQTIPWFGTLKTSGSVYELQSEAIYQEFINARNALFMEVKSAWYPLYELYQKIQLQKENKKVLLSHKQLATTGFKVGKNGMSDVLRVDIMIDEATTEIKLLEEKIKPLSVRFNRLLNKPDTTTIEIDETIQLAEIPLNYRRDSLLVNHPTLRALDLKYQSAQASEALAGKEGAPSFGLGLDYGFMPNARNMIVPTISISLPIYRKKYKALKKEAQLKQNAIEFYKQDFENTLVSNYEMTWYELTRAKERFLLYENQIKKTKHVTRLLMVEYSNSGEDFEEILRMQQDLINYQIGKASAIKDFYTALANLDYLTAKSK